LVAGGRDNTLLVWDVTGRLRGGKLRAADLSAKELEALWDDLGGLDAAAAQRAFWTLAASPGQSLPLLQKRLPPLPVPKQERVTQLLADLDSDQFAVREAAREELEKLDEAVEPALRQALAGKPSPEAKRRMENLLDRLEGSERLRVSRAVGVLEAIADRQ